MPLVPPQTHGSPQRRRRPDSAKSQPRPRLSGGPFGVVGPAIRAVASYRVATLAGPRTAIRNARHPDTSRLAEAQIARRECQVRGMMEGSGRY